MFVNESFWMYLIISRSILEDLRWTGSGCSHRRGVIERSCSTDASRVVHRVRLARVAIPDCEVECASLLLVCCVFAFGSGSLRLRVASALHVLEAQSRAVLLSLHHSRCVLEALLSVRRRLDAHHGLPPCATRTRRLSTLSSRLVVQAHSESGRVRLRHGTSLLQWWSCLLWSWACFCFIHCSV